MEIEEQDFNDLTDNIELLYRKLQRIEVFLNGITIGMAVILMVMVIILIWFIL